MNEYPKRTSCVTVVFIDGEVKQYEINAGSGISQYLAQQVGATGVLTLLNGAQTYNIPVTQIREYSITENEEKKA
jgi:hypothetical protein